MLHRNTALSENTKVSNMTSEVMRRMLHVSEDLPIAERIVVLDRLCQKLANSGYDLEMTRKGLVGGLKGYERRLEQSRREIGSHGYRALHESAGVSFGARSRKKLTGKSSWFKTTKKQLDETEKAEGTESITTAPTIQGHRKEERMIRKEKQKKLKEQSA